MDEKRIEIPAEVGIELAKQFGFDSFTRTCRVVFEQEIHKHYTGRGREASRMLAGITNFSRFYFVIEGDK